eukprot:31085-Amphidinium_carterae.1
MAVRSVRAGKRGFVKYQREALYHERLLLCQISRSRWCVCTPDEDIYVEDLAVIGFIPLTPAEQIPRSLGGKDLCRFDQFPEMLSDEDWAEAFEQGMATAVLDRQGLEMPEADAEAALVRDSFRTGGWQAARDAMARPPGQLRPSGIWVLLRGEQAGKKIEVDASWTVSGQTAVKKVDGEYLLAENLISAAEAVRRLRELADKYDVSSKALEQTGLQGLGLAAMELEAPSSSGEADVRVWPVERDAQGHKYRSYETVLPLLREATMSDWPLTGPRSARWLARFIRDNGGSPRLRTSRFIQDAKVPEGDRVRYEHAMLMEMLEAATVYDQIDVSS